MAESLSPWRERVASVAFPLLFVPLLFVRDTLTRNLGHVLLLVALTAVWDRALLARIARTGVVTAMAAYLGFLVLSTTWGNRGPMGIAEGAGKFVNMLAFVGTVALLSVRAPAVLRRAELVFVGVGAAMAAFLTGLFAVRYTGDPLVRLEGMGAASNSVVAALLFGAALLYALVRLLPSAKTAMGRAAVLLTGLALLTAMVLTQSRGPLVALVAALAVTMAVEFRRHWRWMLPAGAAAAAIVMLAGGHALLVRGFSYRPEIWREALERWTEHPWLGIGASSRIQFVMAYGETINSAHNIFLSALLYSGIVGLALLLVLLAAAAVEVVRGARRGGDRLPMALLAFTLVAGLVDRQIDLRNLAPEYLTIWYACGLLAAQALRRPQDAKVRTPGGIPLRPAA